MRNLKIPEVDGFSAFETDLSIAASTRGAENVARFQEYLHEHGHEHEQIISLSETCAVTENYNGPILWLNDDAPPNFDGLEVKGQVRSYQELEREIGHTEDWKAIVAVMCLSEKLEAYNLSFDEYCNAAEAAQSTVKTRRRL